MEGNSDPIFFVYPFLGAVAKMRARVTRDGTFSSENSTFGYFDETNPPPPPPHYWKRYPVAVSYSDYGSWL